MQQIIVSAPYLLKSILILKKKKNAVATILIFLWNLDQGKLTGEKVT